MKLVPTLGSKPSKKVPASGHLFRERTIVGLQ